MKIIPEPRTLHLRTARPHHWLLALCAAALFGGAAIADGENKAGPFTKAIAYPTGGTLPVSLAVGDLSGDGRPDLLTVARGEHRVQMLPSLAGGGFGEARFYEAGTDPLRVAVGDIDADRQLDLLAIGHFDNGFLVRRGLGGGEVGAPQSYALRNHGRQIAVLDLNDDGFDDVIAVHDGSGQPIYVASFLGAADGNLTKTWEHATEYAASKSIAVGNFDRDDLLDFAVGAGDHRTSVLVFHGEGDGFFATPLTLPPVSPTPGAADGTEQIAAGDLDEDGLDDLVASHWGQADLLSVRLDSDDGFTEPIARPVPVSGDVALGDIDDDGRLDAVLSHPEDGTASVLYGLGGGNFGAGVAFEIGISPSYLALEDLDRDGWLDLAAIDVGDNSFRVLYNRRTGPCAGDCDRGGIVTGDELRTAVEIALLRLAAAECPAFGREASVAVDELVAAVGAARGGCP